MQPMHKLSCYKHLLQTDLVALSALKAFQDCLDFSFITAVYKYDTYHITSTQRSPEEIQHALKNCLLFSNPIKETLLFDSPKHKAKNQLYIEVNEKYPPKKTALEEHLKLLINDKALQLTQSRLWHLQVQDDYPLNEETILKQLVYSSSSTQGLLANPILEEAKLIETHHETLT